MYVACLLIISYTRLSSWTKGEWRGREGAAHWYWYIMNGSYPCSTMTCPKIPTANHTQAICIHFQQYAFERILSFQNWRPRSDSFTMRAVIKSCNYTHAMNISHTHTHTHYILHTHNANIVWPTDKTTKIRMHIFTSMVITEQDRACT